MGCDMIALVVQDRHADAAILRGRLHARSGAAHPRRSGTVAPGRLGSAPLLAVEGLLGPDGTLEEAQRVWRDGQHARP